MYTTILSIKNKPKRMIYPQNIVVRKKPTGCTRIIIYTAAYPNNFVIINGAEHNKTSTMTAIRITDIENKNKLL